MEEHGSGSVHRNIPGSMCKSKTSVYYWVYSGTFSIIRRILLIFLKPRAASMYAEHKRAKRCPVISFMRRSPESSPTVLKEFPDIKSTGWSQLGLGQVTVEVMWWSSVFWFGVLLETNDGPTELKPDQMACCCRLLRWRCWLNVPSG